MRVSLLEFLRQREQTLDRQRRLERARAERLRRTLEGISGCATQCPCCQAHRRLAQRALVEAASIVT